MIILIVLPNVLHGVIKLLDKHSIAHSATQFVKNGDVLADFLDSIYEQANHHGELTNKNLAGFMTAGECSSYGLLLRMILKCLVFDLSAIRRLSKCVWNRSFKYGELPKPPDRMR